MLSRHAFLKHRKNRSTIWGLGKYADLVAAPDEEKNPFSLRVKGGPDRDTMTPIKEPCRVGIIFVARHYLFCQCWPTQAHATGR